MDAPEGRPAAGAVQSRTVAQLSDARTANPATTLVAMVSGWSWDERGDKISSGQEDEWLLIAFWTALKRYVLSYEGCVKW